MSRPLPMGLYAIYSHSTEGATTFLSDNTAAMVEFELSEHILFHIVYGWSVLLLGGRAAVETNIDQQQYELIACLERSFHELLASNSALCCRFDRLEQLVLHHSSAFAQQEDEQQARSSSAVRGGSVPRCIGSGSSQQMCTGRFIVDTADVSEMLPKSCCAQWRDGQKAEMRNRQAENDVHHTDVGVTSKPDDAWTGSAVSSQQDHGQYVADLSDVDAWPDLISHTTSGDTERESTCVIFVFRDVKIVFS